MKQCFEILPILSTGDPKTWEATADLVRPLQTALELSYVFPPGMLERYWEPLPEDPSPWLIKTRDLVEKPELMVERCRPYLDALAGYGAPCALLRAPFLAQDSKQEDLIQPLQRLALGSIALCGAIGCPLLVVRPPFSGPIQEQDWEAGRRFYLSLATAARSNGITILLESRLRTFNGRLMRGPLSDTGTMAAWVDHLNEAAGEERFGISLDTVNTALCGHDLREVMMALGARVKAIRLRDCDGHREASLPPLYAGGQMDWRSLIFMLRELDFDGTIIHDYRDSLVRLPYILKENARQLMVQTAKYVAWQLNLEQTIRKYKTRVLFGAGNMFRNYMYNYGEEYPPLFVCANSPSRWGTTALGVEIRPPEALCDLPVGCGIFICNTYYDEIAKQLRSMGIRNFEYFNDEYLPRYPKEGEL